MFIYTLAFSLFLAFFSARSMENPRKGLPVPDFAYLLQREQDKRNRTSANDEAAEATRSFFALPYSNYTNPRPFKRQKRNPSNCARVLNFNGLTANKKSRHSSEDN